MGFIHWYEGRNYPEQRKATNQQEGEGMRVIRRCLGSVDVVVKQRDFTGLWEWWIEDASTGVILRSGANLLNTAGEAMDLAMKMYWYRFAPTESHETGVNNDANSTQAPTTPETPQISAQDVLTLCYVVFDDVTSWPYLLSGDLPPVITAVIRAEIERKLGADALALMDTAIDVHKTTR